MKLEAVDKAAQKIYNGGDYEVLYGILEELYNRGYEDGWYHRHKEVINRCEMCVHLNNDTCIFNGTHTDYCSAWLGVK